ncbi:MAG TPA: hypothetical protein VK907_06650, partial [Phnomibacter sp.]|nr:hypothetical protein [Phnomibacter sp.]
MLLKQPLIFLSFLVLCVLQGFGQRNYFVYIQTETQESFYVLLNKKNYSSSSAGHVIISGLTNGTHAIEVGFPGQSATLDYQLVISNGDQGFLLRKMEDANTWGLVNMHTTQVQMSGVARREAAEAERQKALAAAAPAVAKVEEPAKAKVETEMKEDVLQQQVKEKEKEVAAVVTEATVALPVKADSVAKLPEPQKIAEPEKASTERRAKEAAEGPVQIKAAPEV